MDMHSRNQYLKSLREEYLKVSKKKKGLLLDEAEKRTSLSRLYLIRKLSPFSNLEPKEPHEKRKRETKYGSDIKPALARVWEIFDYPCGQRLAPLLKTEVERLRAFKELRITNEVSKKLRRISSATIDRKLRHQKEVLHRLRRKGHSKNKSLLYQKIPIRLNDWDTSIIGNLGIDFVEHCGSSKRGEYVNSLSTTDIASGWWEGEGVMGRGQYPTLEALKRIRERTPFKWLEIHPDNDSAFINAHLLRYCQKDGLRFSRSRPNKKNDNPYIEEKNYTHVKKFLGYLRYDTQEELEIINSLYGNELRLYKNFFQPVMKLKSKIRVGAKVKRKYDLPKTPYQRLMESDQIPKETKKELKATYLALNPAQLKRTIDIKLDKLYQVYQEKGRSQEIKPFKKQKARLLTNYMIQPEVFHLPT